MRLTQTNTIGGSQKTMAGVVETGMELGYLDGEEYDLLGENLIPESSGGGERRNGGTDGKEGLR